MSSPRPESTGSRGSRDWSYLVVFGVAMLDAFFPLVPSETVVITAGVLAGAGDLNLLLVILCAATGAIVGDNISYGIGTLARRAHRQARLPERRRRRRGSPGRSTSSSSAGRYLIIVARFIPAGGRP